MRLSDLLISRLEEQVEWNDLNKLLQHHGFKPVYFADPIENKNHSDLVLLDKKSIGEMRMTLRTMLTDSERRQTRIHELVKSNNQLKMEIQEHLSRTAHSSERAAKLEGLLDRQKIRVQNLEDSYPGKAVQQHSYTQQQQEKQSAEELCEILVQKLLKQREETADLQRKLYFTVKEEERRLTHQSQTFQNICKRVNQHSSAGDQQLPNEDKTSQITEHISDQTIEADLCAHYHSLLTKISAVVTSPSAPLQLHRQKPLSAVGGPDGFQALLPTLEVWAQQLHLLKELQRGLNTLTTRLMPWKPIDCDYNSAEAVMVEDMMLLVDSVLENTSNDDKTILKSPTRYTLGSMVSHFQKLFDVTSLSGIYPRMNEVYTRLGEMTNAMKILRDVLDLDARVPPAEVVNKVARLVFSTEHSAGLHNMLGDADIDSIIVKVKQHEEFFPAFHTLIIDILQALGVSRLDDILPALNSLKQTVQ